MRRLQTTLRNVLALAACLGLAAVSLAASGGARTADPGGAVVAAARTHVGDTYTWGATGPHAFDCSGLVWMLWRTTGGVSTIPRTASQQQAWAVPIPVEQALPGDLVFFGDPVTHVGLVVDRSTTAGTSTVTMIDASSSHKGVSTRTVWKDTVVRYGRVPRPGMVPVHPWTPPAPSPAPSRAPDSTSTTPQTTPQTNPQTNPQAALQNAAPSTAVALRAAALARRTIGQTSVTDVGLVRTVWHRAGGSLLPTSLTALSKLGRPVTVRDLRVGDLVVYAAPFDHVGIYVGGGQMVDASRALGKVVLRPYWSSPGRSLLRLPS